MNKITGFAAGGKKFSARGIRKLFLSASLKNLEFRRILLMSRRFPNWLYYALLPIEIIVEIYPFNRMAGIIVCKGEKS